MNFVGIRGIFRGFGAFSLLLAGALVLAGTAPMAHAQTKGSAAQTAPAKPAVTAATNTNPLYVDPTVNRKSEPGYGWLMLRTIFVLALFGGAGVLIWRWLKNRKPMGAAVDGPIRILHDYPLAIGKGVKVMEVGREVFLLGVTQDSIQLISKITDKETLDALRLEAGRQKANPRDSFAELLAKVLPGAKVGKDPLAFTRHLRDRLRRKP